MKKLMISFSPGHVFCTGNISVGSYVDIGGAESSQMNNHSYLGGSGSMLPSQQNFEKMVFKEGPVSRSGVHITTASFMCTIIYLKY